ncbi:HAD family hydrolase [Herbiconiux sp. SYSU D00978]|uniref:HAD family hydrolase n=1 Tax=Herbiconiux sp. SYSU D00978 TaxID=2812562 RepID=UPI001A95B429|nr:HAD family hydrolase [Herbiconiux sp. SYSU D00978]
MTDRQLSVVLFDIDGTLVDSNYLHVDAWHQAFADLGVHVQAAHVHAAIGLDSTKLLERLLQERAEELGDRAKELHSEYYEKHANRLHRFDKVTELFTALRERGLRVVLASSAPQEELELLLKAIDADELIEAATSSSDVETAKPEPDVIQAALQKVGADAAEAIMVGDARWDVEAARNAGVDTIGVLTGGRGVGELTDAGALAVYADPADLLEHLDESPIAERLRG